MGTEGGPTLKAILTDAQAAAGLSRSQFSSEHLPSHEQFDAFNDWFSPILEVTPTGEVDRGFDFSHSSISFGKMSLLSYRRGAALSERDAQRVRKNPLDAVAIVTLREGACHGQVADRDYSLRPGEVLIRDSGRPYRIWSAGTDVVALNFPRETVAALVGDLSLANGRVFRDGAMGLLHDYMLSLVNHADGLESAQMPQISTVAEQLLAVALAPTRDALASAQAPIGDLLRRRAQAYIARNILTDDLTPDRIAAAVAVSRRKLYQLFEGEGGIARYIMGLRLDQARKALTRQYRSGLIKEVAFAHGFKSEAHFTRSFKARFAHSPSETRDANREAAPAA